MDKGSGECRESSQLKRRRMLQFNSDGTDPSICNDETPDAYGKLKVGEASHLLGNNFSQVLLSVLLGIPMSITYSFLCAPIRV